MKLLIADDHLVVREGVKQLLKQMKSFSLIDEAENGNEALKKIEKNKYDLVILDVSMPGKSGLDVLKTIKEKNEKGHILILSIHPQEHYAVRALKLGASGYLCKDSIYEELSVAINTILTGGRYISPYISDKIFSGKKDNLNLSAHELLSDREFQIMGMLAKGRMVKEIAAELFISEKTVSTYRRRILDKMGLKNNAELTNYSIKHNLIE